MKVLLLSNSTIHGEGYLDWAIEEIRSFLPPGSKIAFIPYALHDLDTYGRTASERLEREGFACRSVHESEDPRAAAHEADAIFVGGGNTFRLLTRLYETGLIEAIRERARRGTPYIGSSAGTNLACPTIKTTNDMPIVEPPRFEALNLIPFQINPHYLDPQPDSKHMGETREQRIREFHEVNDVPVVGLREGTWLRLEGRELTLGGRAGARLFRRNESPVEHAPGDSLGFLME